LFTGSPPFLIHFLAPLIPFLRGRLVYRITDFHPECVIAAQEWPSLPLRLLLALTNFWRRHIDGFEVLGNTNATGCAMPAFQLGELPWCATGRQWSFGPDSSLRHYRLPWRDTPSCSTRATMALLTMSRLLRRAIASTTSRVRDGCGFGLMPQERGRMLSRTLEAQGLPFHSSPPVPLERLPGLLLAPHGHLISLKDRFVGYVVPSKVYGCLETAKPVIFVGSDLSDVHLLANSRDRSSYWRVDCGRPHDFAAALEEFADRVQ
jgi:hypothetical protein